MEEIEKSDNKLLRDFEMLSELSKSRVLDVSHTPTLL